MSVRNHLLAAYTNSLRAVLVSQFSSKRFKGGMAGVARLAEHSIPIQVKTQRTPATRSQSQQTRKMRPINAFIAYAHVTCS